VPEPDSVIELGAIVAEAIGRPHAVTADGLAIDLPEPPPDDLAVDICFAFRERKDLDVRIGFDGAKAIFAPGTDDPSVTVTGSLDAFFDFFENRRSSQALFLEGDWTIGDGGGRRRDDVDEIRGDMQGLERALPPAYELPRETRNRVRANAARVGRAFDIVRRDRIDTATFIDEFVATGTPVVFTAGLSSLDWWSFARLRDLFGDAYTHFSKYPNGSYAIAECIDRIVTGDARAFKAALPLTRELRAHYSLPPYGSPDGSPDGLFGKAQALLIAPADDKMPASYRATAWHRDWADNLLAEMIGRKKVQIASPLDEDRFGPTSVPPSHYNVAVDHSPIDSREDLTGRGIVVRHVVLEPGDVLFLPCGWFHTVENLTATAAINGWRVRPPEMLTVD
jgi:hypothetical protein